MAKMKWPLAEIERRIRKYGSAGLNSDIPRRVSDDAVGRRQNSKGEEAPGSLAEFAKMIRRAMRYDEDLFKLEYKFAGWAWRATEEEMNSVYDQLSDQGKISLCVLLDRRAKEEVKLAQVLKMRVEKWEKAELNRKRRKRKAGQKGAASKS